MRAVLRFLGSRWFLSFLGVALLGVLVWLFGPFLSFLEDWIPRAIVIAVMLLVWAGVNIWLDRRRRKNEAALVAGVTAAQADPTAAASAEEVAAMRDKLTTALALLKKASGSRGYLYQQPWYAIIGPPGAGKTTALLNAGLSFPLAAEMGQSAVAGVGGTRMCDWWFTETAVLIDTAGRYTTQDSDSAVDKAGWLAFLGLLKRTRARQPLNGVLVAIALSDIAAAPAAERLAHARAIRRRVKELYDQLGVRVPVYVLFTKADLIAGFTEFFDDLDRERRGQVWGVTFPLNKSDAGTAGLFGGEFKLLVERLNQRLLDRLQTERSPERRTLIAGFPAQVASLAAPLGEFLTDAFGGSRLDPAPVLRGAYLTSGTQEGAPIDRLVGAMARSFGIDAQRAPTLRPQQGRSYFLSRLLKDVIFGEAMLVSRDPAQVRRNLFVRAGAAALALLVALGATAALVQTRQANQAALDQSQTALAAYIKAAQAVPLDPVTTDPQLPAIAPLLDQARALPFGVDAPPPPTQWFPGLSQTGKLGAGAREVYRHALQHILLPRLIVRLENQMRTRMQQPAFLYEATKVYLMLGSAGPLDRGLVKEWMSLDWQLQWPGPAAKGLRDSLERHLAALLDQRLEKVPLDGALIEDARRTFSRVIPGGAGLQHDQGLAAGARAAALAAGRCRRCLRRARVHPPFRRPAHRRRGRLLHPRWVPQGAAAQPAVGDHAGRKRELGTRQGRADRSDQPAGADPATRRDRALHRGLCQAVGRPAGRSRYRADAQPAAGGAGPVYPCLAAVADARPARRYHPSAHPDPAAAIAARSRRCRPGRGAGCDRGGDAGRGQCRRPAARYPRSRQRAAAGTAGQGDRGSLRRADRLRRQRAGRADRQCAEAAERSPDAARKIGRGAGGRCRGRTRRPAMIPRSCCRPRPVAIRSR